MKFDRIKRYLGYVGCLSAASAALGCESIPGAESHAELVYGSEAECDDARQCSGSSLCMLGFCASDKGASYDVALKLTYPDALGNPKTFYRAFAPGAELGVFSLPESAQGRMTVWFDDRQIEGTAIFTQHGAWNGADDPITFVLSSQKNEFSVYASVYDIVFVPSPADGIVYPSMVFDSVIVDAEHSDLTFRITHDSAPEQSSAKAPDASGGVIERWSGLLSLTYVYCDSSAKNDDSAGSDLASDLFHPQVMLRAADMAQSANMTQITLDLPALQETGRGTIGISLPPQRRDSLGKYRLTAVYRLTQSLQMQESLGIFEIGARGASAAAAKEIALRPFESREFVGQLTAPSGANPANAVVTVSASDKNGDLTWKSTSEAPASSDGYFVFDYPANDCATDACHMTYNVHVSYDDEHGLASESFVFDDLQSLKSIPVTAKTPISGTVYAEDGVTGLGGITVSFTPTNGESSRAIEAVTDSDGRYSASLNHRHYDVSVIPSRSSGLPIAFDSVDVAGTEAMVRDFRFAPPTLIFGTCLDDKGLPASEVRTDVYVQSKTGTIVKIASSQTDGNGLFRLFAPGISNVLRMQ